MAQPLFRCALLPLERRAHQSQLLLSRQHHGRYRILTLTQSLVHRLGHLREAVPEQRVVLELIYRLCLGFDAALPVEEILPAIKRGLHHLGCCAHFVPLIRTLHSLFKSQYVTKDGGFTMKMSREHEMQGTNSRWLPLSVANKAMIATVTQETRRQRQWFP